MTYNKLEEKFDFIPDIIVEVHGDKIPIVFVDDGIDLKELFILSCMFVDFIKRYESDEYHIIPLMIFSIKNIALIGVIKIQLKTVRSIIFISYI